MSVEKSVPLIVKPLIVVETPACSCSLTLTSHPGIREEAGCGVTETATFDATEAPVTVTVTEAVDPAKVLPE